MNFILHPGEFPGPLDVRHLLEGMSFLRNPVICRIFREAYLMEKLGSGLIALFNSYLQRKLPRQEILEGSSFIKAILPRQAASDSNKKQSTELSADLQAILDLFGAAGGVSVSRVMELLQISRSTAGRRLASFVKNKLIVKKGLGRCAYYIRNPNCSTFS